jgi:hypothetical protein
LALGDFTGVRAVGAPLVRLGAGAAVPLADFQPGYNEGDGSGDGSGTG